jgi:hypothetical protein
MDLFLFVADIDLIGQLTTAQHVAGVDDRNSLLA